MTADEEADRGAQARLSGEEDDDAMNGESAKRKREDVGPAHAAPMPRADSRDTANNNTSARGRRSRWNASPNEALESGPSSMPTDPSVPYSTYASGPWDDTVAPHQPAGGHAFGNNADANSRLRPGLGYGGGAPGGQGQQQLFATEPDMVSAAQGMHHPNATANAQTAAEVASGANTHQAEHQRSSQRRETVPCPQALVGRLIGKQGETIKDLQRRSGARIQIDQNFPDGQPRLVTIEGEPHSVQVGVELVTSLIGNAPTVGNGSIAGNRMTFECPKSLVGRVIGKGGETINELQRRSGARIQIEQRVPEGQPCVIEVQGDDGAVQEAIRLTQEVMNGKRLDTASGMVAGGVAAIPANYQHMMVQYPYPYQVPRPLQHGGYAYAPAYAQPPYGGVYAPPGTYSAYGAWPVNYGQQQAQQSPPGGGGSIVGQYANPKVCTRIEAAIQARQRHPVLYAAMVGRATAMAKVALTGTLGTHLPLLHAI